MLEEHLSTEWPIHIHVYCIAHLINHDSHGKDQIEFIIKQFF